MRAKRSGAGLQDPAAIAAQCRTLAEAGVTTSTYRLGDGFNEDLMEPFQDELALMDAVCARRLRLRLEAAPGVQVAVPNDYARHEDGWALPDLVAGGEAWAIVRLTVPAAVVASLAEGTAPLLHASLRYADLAGEPRAVPPAALTLEALPSAAWQAIAEDALVARRQSELEAAAIQRSAREAVLNGDWQAAERLLERLEVLARDHEWLAGMLMELRRLAAGRHQQTFAREALYSGQRLSTRVAACVESTRLADDLGGEIPSFLRRKRVQGKKGTAGPEKG